MHPADVALEPPLIDTTPGAEYHSANRRQFQGIPAIERAANGRLWAAWYSGGPGEGPENYVLLTTSGDDGVTWTEPVLVVDPPGDVRAFDECLWHDPRGRLWLFWAQSYRWYDGRAGVWCIRCDDPQVEHPTWSEPRRISDGIMMNKPTILSSGEWLLPVAVWQFEPKPPAPAPRRVARAQCNVLCTEDEGETFAFRGGADLPAGQKYEHMLIERKDGSLWMLMRATYGIGESVSTDGGRTWSPGTPTSLGGPDSRFFVRRLRSGRLLLVNHHDFMRRQHEEGFHKRNTITAFLSDDDGLTWRGGLLIDERFLVSYPDGVQADDGSIYVIYDRERYAAKEILMAVFREEDVLAARCVSPGARMRILVNRAG